MTCGDQHGHLLFETIFSLLYHPETSKSDGMQRQWWSSIFSLFLRLLKSPLPSRDNWVWWHVKTIMVIRFYLFARLLQSLFVIQRRSSPMACEDHHGHSLFFTFKTIVVSICYLETIKFDGIQRSSWSSTFITFKAARFLMRYLMLPMLFLLTGFADWASDQLGGGIARMKLVSYLYFHFISNKR